MCCKVGDQIKVDVDSDDQQKQSRPYMHKQYMTTER